MGYPIWRLAKAGRFLQAAERAFAAGDWETAASRAYYCAYHAAISALESRVEMRRSRWDHVELQLEFRTRFAQRGFLFSSRQAEQLEALREARLIADYEREGLPPRRVQRLLENARHFYDDVLTVVRDV
jgi:uncharacterized protein (UPF0332 family)